MAEQSEELNAFLSEWGITREDLVQIDNDKKPPPEGMPFEQLITMMLWHGTELGLYRYVGDGYFELVEGPRESQ